MRDRTLDARPRPDHVQSRDGMGRRAEDDRLDPAQAASPRNRTSLLYSPVRFRDRGAMIAALHLL